MIAKRFVFVIISLIFFSLKGFSQTDTLHIYYRGLETKILDSTEAKIAKWAKSLNGKKVDIQVISYYNDAQFKKYSQERCDELFIIVNRKARELINITFIGPKKGAKSQRSTADIVYTYKDAASSTAVSPSVPAIVPAAAATGAAATAVPAKEKKTKEKPAPAAQSTVSTSSGNTPATETQETKPKEENAAKSEKSNSKYDFVMDTTYVNGVMKVTKRKVKKQK